MYLQHSLFSKFSIICFFLNGSLNKGSVFSFYFFRSLCLIHTYLVQLNMQCHIAYVSFLLKPYNFTVCLSVLVWFPHLSYVMFTMLQELTSQSIIYNYSIIILLAYTMLYLIQTILNLICYIILQY